MILVAFLLSLASFSLQAADSPAPSSAADALLNSVAILPGNKGDAANRYFKTNDSFLLQLLSQWQAQSALPYDVNAWVMRILKADSVGAAHLWSAIEPKVPPSFQNAAIAAQLYNLWKLGLSQTFFNEWMIKISDPGFRESRIATALHDTIEPNFDRWLVQQAITPTPEQETTLKNLKIPSSKLFATLKAWTFLRRGEEALDALSALPPDHLLSIYLSQTIALARARKNNLPGAAKILKQYAEPALLNQNEPQLLSSHYLQIARLLFQATSFEAAEQFYEKIPNGAPEFFSAQEELTWALLRIGNQQKLRGHLISLSSPVFENQFSPEVYVVRAISNLKLCFYDKVEKDFKDFQRIYIPWALKIDAALKAEDPPKAAFSDFFSKQAEMAIEKRQEETKKLSDLSFQSITAVLPAVGPQVHWERAKKQNLAAIETAKKQLSQEYRRQWKNQQYMLAEAIKKMSFVKVELLSEVRTFAKQATTPRVVSDEITTSSAAALQKRPEQITFPFDGTLWPDELFKLQSITHGRCLQGGN